MTVRLFIACRPSVWESMAAPTGPRIGACPRSSAPLEMKAQDLPMTLGEWKGEDIALDPDLFKAIGAEDGGRSPIP